MATRQSHIKRYRIRWNIFISRIIMFAAIITLAWVAWSFVSVTTDNTTPDSTIDREAQREQTFVVGDGDSLWTIASSVATPEMDKRQIIKAIMSINGLRSPVIHPGTTLTIPVYAPEAMASACSGELRDNS